MMRAVTALVLGLGLPACSSSTTLPSPLPQANNTTASAVPGQVFSVDPTSLQFGSQVVNTTSAPRAVTVTNTGTMPQPVSGRMNGMAGQWQGFGSTNDCPPMLAVGASCTFKITFTPTAPVGWKAILVVDGINDEEGLVDVVGTGTN